MPQFRVLCLSRSTGKQTVRIVNASDEEAAAQAALDAGFLVGTIELLRDDPAATPADFAAIPAPNGHATPTVPHYGPPTTRYAVPESGLSAFFHFRLLLVPWLVRAGFLLLTLAVILLIAAAIYQFVADLNKGMPPRLAALDVSTRVLGLLLSWVLVRIMAEFLIVIFGIHERVAELRRDIEHARPMHPG